MDMDMQIEAFWVAFLLMGAAGVILHFGKREDYPEESWWEMKLGLFEGLEKRYRAKHAKVAKWLLYPGIFFFMISWFLGWS